MQDYPSNISQAERLEFAPIASHLITLDEPECVTISSPPNGFRMPSMEAVRMNDARLSLFASHHEASDECDDDSDDSESLASEKERESFEDFKTELLSERGMSRRALRSEFASMGMEWND